MLALSSPSGAGKSTLTRSLLDGDRDLVLSISVTTRRRRHSEIEGRHYHFIDARRFEQMQRAGELLESAEVHGNRYGTPREPVAAALAAGRDVVFDIDWQGTRQIAAKLPDDLVSIFVLPPSMAELKARLERRAEDDPEVIARRLAAAREEIRHWAEYDYVIVNDDLDRSLRSVRAILDAERLKRARQPGLDRFVDRLLSEKPAG
jgi:guanylate kinase